jgi:DNA modification methylase
MRRNKMKSNFNLETNTIWSFPDRGNWLTHKGDYPGNWSPYVPRNIILRYSKPGDLILDQFVGSGTTLIEAKSLGRNAIGCDVNPEAIKKSRQRIENLTSDCDIKIAFADAKNLNNIKSNYIDLICTHPPYSNIIKYSKDIPEDISLLSINDYYLAMSDVARECLRVLKLNKYCAILTGDTRKNGYIIPMGFTVMNIFLKSVLN